MQDEREPIVEYTREDKDAARDLWRDKVPAKYKKLIEAQEKQ